MRGRKPIPTRLKILNGNPGKRPINADPHSPAILPDCPAHLDDEAKIVWTFFGEQLLKMGVMQQIDGAALAALCVAYARWVKAETILQKSGDVINRDGKLVINPYLKVSVQALKDLKALLLEFGMTPSSRARLSILPPNQERDDFETFLEDDVG